MAGLGSSVGRRGVNARADVIAVQQRLGRLTALLGLPPLPASGQCDTQTVAAIEAFQFRFLAMVRPDGRIDPGGATWTRLVREGDAGAPADPARLSGGAWWRANQARYANSAGMDDLAQPFRDKAGAFVAALRAAGATVRISATRRNATRAWLMHHCFLIAKGQEQPAAVAARSDCDIIWDHGDLAASRRAAQEMVDLFGIAFLPSLNSRHIEGKAIDMTISWQGTLAIRDAAGRTQQIGAPRDGSNGALHKVGRSYGAVKLVSDPPHWSSDGH